MQPMRLLSLSALALALGAPACSAHSTPPGQRVEPELPSYYEFESRFFPGQSSVDRSETIALQVLISDLDEAVGLLRHHVDDADRPPFDDGLEPGEVAESLDLLFSAPASERADLAIGLTTQPPALQTAWRELSETATLAGALAGSDGVGDDRDPSASLAGFDASLLGSRAVTGPESLVRAVLATLDDGAVARAEGRAPSSPVDPDFELPPEVTPEGLDLRRLLVEYLAVAVLLHTATDHLLDEAVEESDNDRPVDGRPYTALEHAWDLAFGAFGASTHYLDFDARELAEGPRFADFSGDGRVDLTREYNFGAAVEAARRDRDSSRRAPTDHMGDAWLAFLTGRAIIAEADGALSPAERAALDEQRDRAVAAWEAIVAATLVHHINGTLEYFEDWGTPDFEYTHGDFLEHARDHSSALALSLGLALDPRSPLDVEAQATLRDLLGDAPVLPLSDTPDEEVEAHIADLLAARALIGETFAFDEDNLGDEAGGRGW